MGGGTSMLVVRTDEGRPTEPTHTTTLSLLPIGVGRAMMQIVFETTARDARQNVSDRMNELMQSLFEFIEDHVGQENAAAPPEKKTAARETVASLPTRTCSRADEASAMKDLPVPVLKRWMDDYALDYRDCVEKKEMVDRIAQNCFPSAECYVCLESYAGGDRIRRLPCKHEFHCVCVDRWLIDVHRTCPTCRQDITGDTTGDEADGEDAEYDEDEPEYEYTDDDDDEGSYIGSPLREGESVLFGTPRGVDEDED